MPNQKGLLSFVVLLGLIGLFSFPKTAYAFSGKILFIFNNQENIINFLLIKECPNSGLSDPAIPGVYDCLSWFAYGQSIGNNIQNWCANATIAKKCCLTCQSKFIN